MRAALSRVCLTACLFASAAALGAAFPNRNVTIVVSSAAGALTDTLTRARCTAAVGFMEAERNR